MAKLQSNKEVPDHVRAVNALLAVCRTGINNPSRKMRLTFAILAELIENKSDEWGEEGPDVMGGTSSPVMGGTATLSPRTLALSGR